MELTLDKLAKDVAEKALDDITYEGKTIREWIDILAKQQTSEDCVSRDAMMKCFKKWQPYMATRILGYEQELSKLPSVTLSRPKGKWICHRDHCESLGVIPSGLGVYEWCSNCDCGIDIREWQRNHYNFCPNCGADMRGDKNEMG